MNPTYVRGLLCNKNGGLTDSNLDFMNHRAWSGYLSCDDYSYSIDDIAKTPHSLITPSFGKKIKEQLKEFET